MENHDGQFPDLTLRAPHNNYSMKDCKLLIIRVCHQKQWCFKNVCEGHRTIWSSVARQSEAPIFFQVLTFDFKGSLSDGLQCLVVRKFALLSPQTPMYKTI